MGQDTEPILKFEDHTEAVCGKNWGRYTPCTKILKAEHIVNFLLHFLNMPGEYRVKSGSNQGWKNVGVRGIHMTCWRMWFLNVLELLTETKKNFKVRFGAINNYLGIKVINWKQNLLMANLDLWILEIHSRVLRRDVVW